MKRKTNDNFCIAVFRDGPQKHFPGLMTRTSLLLSGPWWLMLVIPARLLADPVFPLKSVPLWRKLGYLEKVHRSYSLGGERLPNHWRRNHIGLCLKRQNSSYMEKNGCNIQCSESRQILGKHCGYRVGVVQGNGIQVHGGRRWFDRGWWEHNAMYRSRVTEMYTWNPRDLINDVTLINLIKINK